MRLNRLSILAFGIVAFGGCARWQPEGPGRATLPEACPMRRAPAVAEFGPDGLRAVYHFVTQNASNEELGALIDGTATYSFALAPMTVTINGRDSMFARGAAVLRSQREVDSEFGIACRLGRGRVYLTHVRYNPARQQGENVRAR